MLNFRAPKSIVDGLMQIFQDPKSNFDLMQRAVSDIMLDGYAAQDVMKMLLDRVIDMMDSKAKSFATTIRITDTFEVPHSPLGFGLVSCNGSLISSNLSKQLYHQLCHQDIVRHLETRWALPHGLLATKVDWPAFQKARVNSSAPIQKFITKWLSESLPTGRVMVQRQQRIHDHCPLCQEADEHLLHIVCCPDTRATAFFASELNKFTCWLEKINTHVAIIDFFDNGLDNWRHNPMAHVPLLHFYPVDAQFAFRKQLEVGWFLTLCGFLSPALLQLPAVYNGAKNVSEDFGTYLHKLGGAPCRSWRTHGAQTEQVHTVE